MENHVKLIDYGNYGEVFVNIVLKRNRNDFG